MIPVPRSPFTTPLSGSARETELRIRSIFQWKKQRPPLWAMVLIAALVLSCGGLAACQVQGGTQSSGPAALAGPTFSLTEPGREVLEFDALCGFSGSVTHTVTEEGSHWYDYQALLPNGASFCLAEGSGPMYHLDLDGDGALELLENDPALGALRLWRRWPDSSVRSQELQQAGADLLNLEGEGWKLVDLAFHPEDTTVTVTPVSGTPQTVPLSRLIGMSRSGEFLFAPLTQDGEAVPIDSTLPDGILMRYFDGLELDGTGSGDDVLILSSFGPGPGSEGSTLAEVTLGSGARFRWSLPSPSIPAAAAGYLTHPEHQSLVLELADRYSNYGGTSYVVLDVEDGALVERARIGQWDDPEHDLLSDGTVLSGAYVSQQEDHPLPVLRVPVLIDKWHSPCYVTLAWENGQFSAQADDHFTDTELLSLPDGGPLTLALTGRWRENSLGLRELYYDRIQVLEGDRLLQTITPPHALPQPRAFDSDTAAQVTPSAANAPASGFSAENQFHALDLRDVNFDGFPDLGLPWDTTHNDVHLWYLWDGGTRTFQYAFALQGDLTIDTDQQLLTENRWEEGPHIYSFNARGQICWYGPGGA